MVHVYNCHPFASQHIVSAEQEPGLVCCGGGALFVVCGCRIEAYDVRRDGCPLICRFSSVSAVRSIRHSGAGDYLVTIEEKNGAMYLRAYTNWRYQAVEKTRVGVRLLGHLLRGPSFRGAPKEQMEIIEIPLFEPPLCMACCPLTGDLLVGCAKSLVVFNLKRQKLSEQLSLLDFERVLILHIQGLSPSQVAFCAGYVALQTELEVLVVKLTQQQNNTPDTGHDRVLLPDDYQITDAASDEDAEMKKDGFSPLQEQEDFFMFPKHQEMLGSEAQECGVSILLEWTGIDAERSEDMSVCYVLYRRFAPDFFQGCSVEETHLHSLQLHPMFTATQEESTISKGGEPTCMFVFFSLPNTGYMYSLKDSVELVSTYQYPEKTHQAVLSNQFLYVITRNALQCFTVRCSAVAARVDDPYIDTTMKACPPVTMEVCILRIQLFIGLKALCHDGNHIVLLTAADVDNREDVEKPTRKNTSRKTSVCKSTEPTDSGHGWNLYVITCVSTLQLYREIVEYSKRYEQSSPLSQSCVHLLSEAHLLLRSALLTQQVSEPHLQQAFQESCAHLADCFSRLDKKDCHLALPYYKMSGLSVTDVVQRNMAMCSFSSGYGRGFLFYLKHSLYDETAEELGEDMANKVLEIFSVAEPSQLPYVVSNPSMQRADPDCAMTHLRQLEISGTSSITLSLCMASLALRKDDLHTYRQQMDRHAEMLQVYSFIEEPKLLLHGRGKAVVPTVLAKHLRDTQEGLLVAAVVVLHENRKIRLEEADLFFQELCKDEVQKAPQFLLDFWEALLVASAHESIIQELLFRLVSVYIDRITCRDRSGVKALKTAEDLINSCCHYGMLYPWVSILTPVQFDITHDQQDLHKLQSLLCGPTLEVSSVLPLLEQLSDRDNTGLSVHLLCASKLGRHESSIDKLLERCPQAIISYARHELQNEKLCLWWQKLFPELCKRIRRTGNDITILSALREVLAVMAIELNPLEFLDLLPDDGMAQFFLPHLLECSQRNLLV